MPAPAQDLEIQAAARLLAEGRAPESVRILERLVGDAPAYAAAHVLLARAREAVGSPALALESWHRAHFLVPTSPLVTRERRRLLEVVPAEPESPPAPAVEEAPAADYWAAVEAPTADQQQETVAPVDAIWDDEAAAGTEPPHPPETVDAPEGAPEVTYEPVPEPPVEPALGPEATYAPAPDEAFELPITPGVDPDVPPPRAESDDRGRVFAEEAFAADEDFDTSSTVFTTVPEITIDSVEARPLRDRTDFHEEDEGWTLLHETIDDRPPSEGLAEADVAPPLATGPTGWEVVPAPGTGEPTVQRSTLDWDLDALIREIEEAPRIRPDPHFAAPAEGAFEPTPDDADVVSETLARIYEAQGELGEAATVYEKLADQRPERADEFRGRAAELRSRARA